MKTSLLLILLSLVAVACNQKDIKTAAEQTASDIELVYHVEGMTCDHCEMSVQKGVNELEGIVEVEANHEDSTARVVYNPSKTDPDKIIAAIEKRGYHVVR
jgi:copper chaperone CopZ